MFKITRQIRYCPLILIACRDKQPKRKSLEILSIFLSLTIEKNNLRQLGFKKKKKRERKKRKEKKRKKKRKKKKALQVQRLSTYKEAIKSTVHHISCHI